MIGASTYVWRTNRLDQRTRDRRVLYIAAKAPRPGFAKTRLGNALGHDVAIALYLAFVRDIAERFAHAPFDVGWYVTPPDAWADLQPVVSANGRVAALSSRRSPARAPAARDHWR